MSISKNIKELRNKFDLSQKDLAEIAGVSDKAVSTWENGSKEPRMGAIQKIADHFGLLKSNLIEEDGMKNILFLDRKEKKFTIENNFIIPIAKSKEVPLYGSISAGLPIEMIAVDDYIEIPSNIANTYPSAFLLEVKGDSMNKLLPTGTYALIEPCQEVENGTVAAVAINGYEATLKRFHKLSNGIVLEPESYNPEHSTQLYDCNEIDCGDIKILGKLVWHMAPTHIKY